MIKVLFLLLMGLFFSGCVTVPYHYTPESDLRKNKDEAQFDLTYSIDCVAEFRSSMKNEWERHIKEILDEKFRKSDFYSSVFYKKLSEKSRYHVHVIVSYAVDYPLGLGVDAYFDLSFLLYLDGKKVFSVSTSDKARSYPGALLIPSFIYGSPKKVWTRQERNCVNYLLNQMTDFQKKQLEQKTAEESDFE